jgi:hypothetical protein
MPKILHVNITYPIDMPLYIWSKITYGHENWA